MRSVALPMALVLFPTLIWMGYYNYRVTGHPLLMPYSLYEKQYSSWSQFVWASPRPEPKYDHAVFIASGSTGTQRQAVSAAAYSFRIRRDLVKILGFFLWIPLVGCVAFSSPRLLRNPRLRIPLMVLLVFYLGLALESDLAPHYFAPATVLLFRSPPRRSRTSQRDSRRGRCALATVALFYCIGLFELPWITHPLSGLRFDLARRFFIAERKGVHARLDKEPRKLLVFVRYGPHHYIHNEWVYNDADIDQSRIVWGRM